MTCNSMANVCSVYFFYNPVYGFASNDFELIRNDNFQYSSGETNEWKYLDNKIIWQYSESRFGIDSIIPIYETKDSATYVEKCCTNVFNIQYEKDKIISYTLNFWGSDRYDTLSIIADNMERRSKEYYSSFQMAFYIYKSTIMTDSLNFKIIKETQSSEMYKDSTYAICNYTTNSCTCNRSNKDVVQINRTVNGNLFIDSIYVNSVLNSIMTYKTANPASVTFRHYAKSNSFAKRYEYDLLGRLNIESK